VKIACGCHVDNYGIRIWHVNVAYHLTFSRFILPLPTILGLPTTGSRTIQCGMTRPWQSARTVDFGIPLAGERRYRRFACTTKVAGEIRAEKKTGMTEEQRGDVRVES
jgi:hypothetical protein